MHVDRKRGGEICEMKEYFVEIEKALFYMTFSTQSNSLRRSESLRAH